LLIKSDYKYDRKELLDSIQLQEQHKLFDLLSEYFIHLDVFTSGFNRGIDVIDEASMVNNFAKELQDITCLELSKLKNKIKQEINILKRYSLIEHILIDWIKVNLN